MWHLLTLLHCLMLSYCHAMIFDTWWFCCPMTPLRPGQKVLRVCCISSMAYVRCRTSRDKNINLTVLTSLYVFNFLNVLKKLRLVALSMMATMSPFLGNRRSDDKGRLQCAARSRHVSTQPQLKGRFNAACKLVEVRYGRYGCCSMSMSYSQQISIIS